MREGNSVESAPYSIAGNCASPAAPQRCSVILTTRNRREELLRTCGVLEQLDPGPDEVLIFADGCRDGSAVEVRRRFPAFHVFEGEGRGSIPARDFLIRRAIGDIILSFDDDSYPLRSDHIGVVRELFAMNPEIGILFFPQRTDEYPETLAKTEFGEAKLGAGFYNSAAAFRKNVYLEAGGFVTFFSHMGEEPDFAMCCIAQGKEVVFFPKLVVRHHFSAIGRNEIRNHHLHARNEMWSTWLRCPLALLPVMTAWRWTTHIRYAGRRGPKWLVREPLWWWDCLKGVPRVARNRQPVSIESYLRWIRLRRRPQPKKWQNARVARTAAVKKSEVGQ